MDKQDLLQPQHPRRASHRLYAAAVLLLVAGVAALPLDLMLANLPLQKHLPGDLRKVVNLSEAFAHGSGVALILLAAWVLDPRGRRQLWLVGTCAFGSGALAQVSKMLLPRLRPNSFEGSAHVLQTFLRHQELSAEPYSQMSHVAVQSMPSGHTATAVGLAVGLSWVYPRGRWLFAGLAALAAFQRMFVRMHYLSDVLVAAALACAFSGICLDPRLLGRLLLRSDRQATGGQENGN